MASGRLIGSRVKLKTGQRGPMRERACSSRQLGHARRGMGERILCRVNEALAATNILPPKEEISKGGYYESYISLRFSISSSRSDAGRTAGMACGQHRAAQHNTYGRGRRESGASNRSRTARNGDHT